ncbi:unnamed protein product [Bursaphelenchus okinawaensis]|uniref:Polypeptide N-acetylgalactosaminyltransferase n=1 Tax=Bursaphelenchus okinawaensis TaxID=465554 RepID=A0A811L7B2_9BILA|nr:unnamed protein product [Bursaphelenchus okinawaensis]CAG9118270.1 unnamed protein product [Bursaphelenchus okinawaensis]
MVSVKRKIFEFQRLFRHQTFVLIILLIGFFTFLSYIHTVRNITKNEVLESQRLVRRPSNRQEQDVLPGDHDPAVILQFRVLGNFEPKEMPPKTGEPGDYGEAINVDMNKQEVRKAMSEFGFNTYVSDMVSMTRSVPDVRMDECKYWHYPEDLPTASVVIAFHNEGFSPLLRTVHSVLLRSPSHLLKEVILVDDFSDKDHLKQPLEDYIKQFEGKVKLIRNEEREGLIRTRTNGAKASEGDVVIFLDAHCEVNYNWLVPLLAPIRYNKKVMTVPIIDGIDMNTWEYRRVYGGADRHFRGIFEWGLLYKETELPAEEKERRIHNSEPFRSPTHAGGLFAIDREWFKTLGYYDPGLQIWGGEQYELSFKIWQCGGGILFVPCSHVGHVYRSHMPYGFGKLSGKPVISTNMLRVIKTWMDDYDKYYYIREPQAVKRTWGDITEQLELKRNLQCKSFKWYMQKVAYDVERSYPLLPENDVWGEAKNKATGKCIDTMGQGVPGRVGATPCHGYGGNQMVRINKAGQMAQGEWCIRPVAGVLKTGHCTKGTVNGPFQYDKDTQQIKDNYRDKCLTVRDDGGSDLISEDCNPGDPNQKWVWTPKY